MNDTGAAELLGELHPALVKAKADLEARRTNRQRPGYLAPVSSRHQPLRKAQRFIGSGDKSDVDLWLIIMYCPGCLRGHVVDLVRYVPDRLPDARELGLKRTWPWRSECPEAES